MQETSYTRKISPGCNEEKKKKTTNGMTETLSAPCIRGSQWRGELYRVLFWRSKDNKLQMQQRLPRHDLQQKNKQEPNETEKTIHTL